MTPRKIILLLAVILAVVIGGSYYKSRQIKSREQSLTPETSKVNKLTGTFVDQLLGRFVYYKEGGFYEVKFPSLESLQLAGVVGQEATPVFPAVRPAWSRDGTQFAIVADESNIAITEYASGKRISLIQLDPKLDLSKRVEISFSLDGQFLIVKQDKEDRTHLRFFNVATGKLIGEQSSCEYLGFWLHRNAIYVTTCQLDGKATVVALDPEIPESLVTKIGQAQTYTLLNEFDSSSLLVKKGDKVGKLTYTGQFVALSSKQFASIPIQALADLPRALAEKIELEKKTEKIDDIVVSPSNDFAIFHTQKGLWVIDIPTKSEPYYLFPGILPSIQPL